MIRQDYLLRMIEQFARMVARILGLSKVGQQQEARPAPARAFRELLGLDCESAVGIPASRLVLVLTIDGDPEAGRNKCAYLAALLNAAGIIYAAQEQPGRSQKAYLQALRLLLEMQPRKDGPRLPDYTPTVEELVAAARPAGLPPETNLALLHYFEQAGDYAKAEDALFELREAQPDNAAVVDLGIAFYRRLQQQSDDTLAAGNLPRDEVEAGLAEMESRRREPPGKLTPAQGEERN
jgi:hypothetical protein